MLSKPPEQLEDLTREQLIEFARISFELECSLRNIELPPCIQSRSIQKQLEHHRRMVKRIFYH